MKILFLYLFPLYGNGSGAFLRELSSKLSDRGHDIAILSPDKRKLKNVKHFLVTPPQNGVFVGHPELPDAKKFADMSGRELGDIFISYFRATLSAIDEFKPDVIHAFHMPFLPEIARIVKEMYGIKYLITSHGSELNYLVQDRRLVPLIRESNRAAKFITANSEFTKQWYLKVFGPDITNKTSVIVGGVNIEHYTRDQKLIDEINKKYNVTNKKVVLFTGRLTKHKGVIHLVKAAKRFNNAVLLIVGDGPERKNIEEEVRRLGLPNVVFAGYINTSNPMFHAFYERADVYVSPSVWDEPLGLTILEAMAAHCPVVATRKGGVLTIINEGVNGFLVKARNSTEISDMVNLLLYWTL